MRSLTDGGTDSPVLPEIGRFGRASRRRRVHCGDDAPGVSRTRLPVRGRGIGERRLRVAAVHLIAADARIPRTTGKGRARRVASRCSWRRHRRAATALSLAVTRFRSPEERPRAVGYNAGIHDDTRSGQRDEHIAAITHSADAMNDRSSSHARRTTGSRECGSRGVNPPSCCCPLKGHVSDSPPRTRPLATTRA